MKTTEEAIVDSFKSFGEEAAELTTSALRMLTYTELGDVQSAIAKRDYIAAREAANALVQTLAFLEEGTGGAG